MGELVDTALLGNRYDWAVLLCRWGGSDAPSTIPLRPLAKQLLRKETGAKTGKILQAARGREAATRVLRSMIINLEVPPTHVGDVTFWLGDPAPVRSRMSEYIRLALCHDVPSTGYADIVRWAKEGDLDKEVGQRLLDLLLRAKDLETALLVVHGSGLRSKHRNLFIEAEKTLAPASTVLHSSYWVNIAYDKCWQDWSLKFKVTPH